MNSYEINCNVSGIVLQGLFNVEASCKVFEPVVFENAEHVLERLLYIAKATQLLTEQQKVGLAHILLLTFTFLIISIMERLY